MNRQPNIMAGCQHQSLCFDVSHHAAEAGYERATAQKRLAAAQPSGRVPSGVKGRAAGSHAADTQSPLDSTFPAPLVLPGDELAWDPNYPPQSLLSWTREKDRNRVTNERRTIYVVAPPSVDKKAPFVVPWAQPNGVDGCVTAPATEDVLGYLQAFYHGLEVKLLKTPSLRFDVWDEPTCKQQPQPHR